MSLLATSAAIAEIPSIVWSGISGATLALLGVVIANWQNLKRQRDQHAFDAREKRRDRILTLRREVYLPLAGSWQEALGFLGTLAASKNDSVEPLTKFTSAAMKLAVVAEMPTAILANKASSELAKAYLHLNQAAIPARQASEQIETFKEFRIAAQENVKIAQQEIDKFLRGAQTDRIMFEALTANKKRYDELVDQYWTMENNAQKQRAIQTIQYLREVASSIPQLAKFGFTLFVEARRDFELETDEAAYAAAYNAEQDSLHEVMQKTIDQLSKLLDEDD